MISKVRQHLSQNEALLFERSSPGKKAYQLPELDVPAVDAAEALGAENVRAEIEGFPEVSEVEAIRHFTRLSTWNYAIDHGMYPLGSCTMKYNPRINELVARIEGLAWAHPYQPEALSQGCMQVMARLERLLAEITGMDAVTLQPAAGAHGELTGILLIRALLEKRGNPRKKILIPDSAHGTNPATAAIAGYAVENIKSSEHRRAGPGRARRPGERRRGRPDGDQSQYAGRVRRKHHPGGRDSAPEGRHALHGRRQHERAGGDRAARRFRRGRDAPESAQDVFHAAWRRRSGRRSGGREEGAGAVPAHAAAEAVRQEAGPSITSASTPSAA